VIAAAIMRKVLANTMQPFLEHIVRLITSGWRHIFRLASWAGLAAWLRFISL